MKVSILILILLTFTQNAFSQVANIIPGSRPGTDSGIINYSISDSVIVRAAADHSIYCRYKASVTVDMNFSQTVDCALTGCPITASFRGETDSGIDEVAGGNDAIAFITPNNDLYGIEIDDITPNPSNLIIECFDTTLYGNFNTITAANPFNFLEISNDTDSTASVRMIVISNSGVELSRSNLSIPAFEQRDVSVHDIPGSSNTFGKIIVAHDTIPNGIRANVSKYRLDGSSFVITATSPLTAKPNAL